MPIERAQNLTPGFEATGRFVRASVTTPDECVFVVRSMWVSYDLGLPGLGINLSGRLRVADGKAEVSVFAPLSAAVLFGGFWIGGMVVTLATLVRDPGGWNGFFVFLCMWIGYYYWLRSREAVDAIADDVVAALNSRLGSRS